MATHLCESVNDDINASCSQAKRIRIILRYCKGWILLSKISILSVILPFQCRSLQERFRSADHVFQLRTISQLFPYPPHERSRERFKQMSQRSSMTVARIRRSGERVSSILRVLRARVPTIGEGFLGETRRTGSTNFCKRAGRPISRRHCGSKTRRGALPRIISLGDDRTHRIQYYSESVRVSDFRPSVRANG